MDHRAHGAVEHQNPLAQQLFQELPRLGLLFDDCHKPRRRKVLCNKEIIELDWALKRVPVDAPQSAAERAFSSISINYRIEPHSLQAVVPPHKCTPGGSNKQFGRLRLSQFPRPFKAGWFAPGAELASHLDPRL